MSALHFLPILATTDPITVFQRCDLVDRMIVAALGLFSIIAWAIMLGKSADLKNLRRLNGAFDHRLREERRLLDLPESVRKQRSIPYADLFSDAVEAYWRGAAIGNEKGTDTPRFRLELAENALQRAVSRQTLRYESSMIFLASIVSGAPFIGLLGTVWGVMEA
ncbi:MAG: MotA/TolQ/ExbB proton channel family protein, partial [Opitutaceae bacterium]